MGYAIGQMLPAAVGITISPLPIVAVVPMLATPRGRSNGLAFVAAWLVSLAAADPKNLLLAVAGAAVIAQAGLGAGQAAGAVAIFVVIATLGVAAPVAVAFVMGDRSRRVLDGLRAWLVHHNAAIMTVLLLVIGVKLIGDAISGFAA